MALSNFHPAVASWFAKRFGAATEPQARAWPEIRAGRHTLIAAPTGSGKTLAAFLSAIDDLVRQAQLSEDGGRLPDETEIVYVSPLKALSNDVEKNLEEPLAGIRQELVAMGLPDVEIRTQVRTGDTPASVRTAMAKRPPHILVTTPESLFILLTSESGRRMLRTTRTVIVDEIHAVADDKRGSHLSLSLERLEALCTATPPLPVREGGRGRERGPGGEGPRRLVRVGLSATQRPIEEVARFLVGTANVEPDGTPRCAIVDAGHGRRMDLAVEVPASSPLEAVMPNEVWEEIYDRLAELIREHRTTLVFANTRRRAERVTRHLSERLGADRVASHHGSMSKENRLESERRLKAGELSALVATASLELGIDIGSVDLVCQLGSTRSIATLLQRVGRSGHHLGGSAQGAAVPVDARRAGGVRGPGGRRPPGGAGPADHSGEAARHPGPAHRGRRGRGAGGRGGGGRAVRPGAAGLAVPEPGAEGLRRGGGDALDGLHHPPRAPGGLPPPRRGERRAAARARVRA